MITQQPTTRRLIRTRICVGARRAACTRLRQTDPDDSIYQATRGIRAKLEMPVIYRHEGMTLR